MLRYEVADVRKNSQTCEIQPSQIVTVTVGRVELLRRLSFKKEFFVPFIPTKFILFVFPTHHPLKEDDAIQEETLCTLSHYFEWLAKDSGLPFKALDLLVCTLSGCVVSIIDCSDVLSAIEILSVSQKDTAPTIGTRCVLSFPCDRDTMSMEKLRSSYYVVPTCPICAERLEPTLTGYTAPVCRCASGVCRCFLDESSCAVCHALLRMQQNSTCIQCEQCRLTGDPWICLACGFVGCSRYQRRHAREHFLQQQHLFSMSLLTQQVWDYDSDGFVHRIVVTFDSATGGARRVQYPDRDNPPAALDPDEDEEDVQHNAHSGDNDRVAPGSTLERAKKKHINAKYDSKVETSNEHLALMIKEQLDVRRAEYESEMYAPPIAASLAPPRVRAGSEAAALYSAMGGAGDGGHASRRQWSALFLANQNLHEERRQRQREEAALVAEMEKHEGDLRAAVQRYATEERHLLDQIGDTRETLREVEANVRMRQRIAAQLGEDTAQQVVVVGNVKEKKKRPSK